MEDMRLKEQRSCTIQSEADRGVIGINRICDRGGVFHRPFRLDFFISLLCPDMITRRDATSICYLSQCSRPLFDVQTPQYKCTIV